MRISRDIQSMSDDFIQARRYLHTIPETGFDLPETQKYIMEKLAECNPDKMRKIASSGVKAVFLTEGASETIAFRADMDAINNCEISDVPYSSQHDGKMHGCGHDGHMTVLLMLARLIAANRSALKYNVVLLFQPGEEGYAGARRMIEEGALQSPAVDRIYGLHLWPTVPKGKIGIRWGYLMAQTSDFDIVVRGKSAHASTPQMGIDAIVVAAELINMLQAVITRNVDPHQDALLTLGTINGGTAHNVIADSVKISGTMRVFNSTLFDSMSRRIHAVADGLSTATGAKFEINEHVHYPCVSNPRDMVERFYGVLDSMDDAVLVEPVMAAEDFAEYQTKIPGMFFFLGINGGKGGVPLHSNDFDFDEDALMYGTEIFRRILNI